MARLGESRQTANGRVQDVRDRTGLIARDDDQIELDELAAFLCRGESGGGARGWGCRGRRFRQLGLYPIYAPGPLLLLGA